MLFQSLQSTFNSFIKFLRYINQPSDVYNTKYIIKIQKFYQECQNIIEQSQKDLTIPIENIKSIQYTDSDFNNSNVIMDKLKDITTSKLILSKYINDLYFILCTHSVFNYSKDYYVNLYGKLSREDIIRDSANIITLRNTVSTVFSNKLDYVRSQDCNLGRMEEKFKRLLEMV
tara:strand:- start:1115 stop:1633 length:519 start_codon:yes stop_codon:yes gene_type:complete